VHTHTHFINIRSTIYCTLYIQFIKYTQSRTFKNVKKSETPAIGDNVGNKKNIQRNISIMHPHIAQKSFN